MSATNGNGTNGHLSVLLPQHLADLRKSGLTDDTIKAHGFRSIIAPEQVRQALRWKGGGHKLGDCLAIPFHDPYGNRLADYLRLKPSRPRQSKAGKAVKYESPKGSTNRAYFPLGIGPAIADPTRPLVITEGEKKACMAQQEGIGCIGLVGVYGWQVKRDVDASGRKGERLLIPDLAAVPWAGRVVYVCYDSDAEEKVEVRWAEYHLAGILAKHGAVVRVMRLPAGPGGAKVGLDDFLVSHDAAAFWDLTKSATAPQKPARDRALESPEDPDRLARLYLDAEGRDKDGTPTLRFWQQQWHRWTGKAYRALTEDEFRASVHAVIKAEFDRLNVAALAAWQPKDDEDKPPTAIKVKRGLVTDVDGAIRSHVIVPNDVERRSWLAEDGPQPMDLIAMENGLLDLPALLAGKSSVLRSHSPRWFSPVVLPYRFDPSATAPRWLAFLKYNLEDDRERIALLQEFFGYCLVYSNGATKFLTLLGEGANGKTVALAALEAMLDPANCSYVPLEVFGVRFQLWPTVGKLVNICGDAGELDKVAEGHIKAFTDGNPMMIDRKNREPFQGPPTARLVVATNNLPRFADKSDGIWRRQLIMPFRVQVPDGKQVPGMKTAAWWRATGELPGIFNWAVAGLHRLQAQGWKFTKSTLCTEEVTKARESSNPAMMLLKDHYAEGDPNQPADIIPGIDVYAHYSEWCLSHGYMRASYGTFGREVARTFPKVVRKRHMTADSRRLWHYFGLKRL